MSKANIADYCLDRAEHYFTAKKEGVVQRYVLTELDDHASIEYESFMLSRAENGEPVNSESINRMPVNERLELIEDSKKLRLSLCLYRINDGSEPRSRVSVDEISSWPPRVRESLHAKALSLSEESSNGDVLSKKELGSMPAASG